MLGVTVADNCLVWFCSNVTADVFNATPETFTTCSSTTVTVHVAVSPPLTVVAVIVVVPAANAVILPFEFTIATFLLLLDHTTAVFVASPGVTVASNVSLVPFVNCKLVLFKLTPVTFTTNEIGTVTLQVAVCTPFSSLNTAVTIAEPCFKPINNPSSVTFTTSLLLLDHSTFVVVASSGPIIAASTLVSPANIVTSLLFSTKLSTGTLTSILHSADILGVFVILADIVAVPAACVVTTPFLSTVATVLLLLVQETDLSTASSGNTFAPNVIVSPFNICTVSGNFSVTVSPNASCTKFDNSIFSAGILYPGTSTTYAFIHIL